ncbi:MAG: sorting domain protein [Phenylobacterium sp.]|jgi:hypothetical protein|nr:sorting domain protein [Phenylobacterium sp.]
MSHTTIKMLAIAACLSVAGAAQAATVYTTTLAGSNENPPNASPGTGQSTLTINGDLMTLQASFAGLLTGTTAAHIHCCASPPSNASVATPVPTFPGFPTGVTSGSYLQTFDLSLASSYNPAFVTANGGVAAAQAAFLAGLAGGQAYLNIHTVGFAGGEIRGQYAAVPEPGTWALMITGFGLVGAAARRRRTMVAA